MSTNFPLRIFFLYISELFEISEQITSACPIRHMGMIRLYYKPMPTDKSA